MVNAAAYNDIRRELNDRHALLVAVSKTKPAEDILALYQLGQRDFGENYVQELLGKQAALPADIRWHFIGHLQSNKVKLIAPFVALIHSVDSLKLLREIDKQGMKNGRVIDCLLQVHIAEEETKFGFDANELAAVMDHLEKDTLSHARVVGLMGMASFSSDAGKVHNEFRSLHRLYNELRTHHPEFSTLSMGMSADYAAALGEGSTLVRIGSLLFGQR